MIDHAHHCIFIHISRCAGTSVESWLVGRDWWLIEPQTKHLLASQARALYADWWDHYFKFAIVRHPMTRCVSMLRYPAFYGIERSGTGLDFSGYHARFGDDLVVEYDYRFHERDAVLTARHRTGTIYGNTLDEELDFVARYETLEADMSHVRAVLGVRVPFAAHVERSGFTLEPDAPTREHIRSLYREDFERFGFKP